MSSWQVSEDGEAMEDSGREGSGDHHVTMEDSGRDGSGDHHVTMEDSGRDGSGDHHVTMEDSGHEGSSDCHVMESLVGSPTQGTSTKVGGCGPEDQDGGRSSKDQGNGCGSEGQESLKAPRHKVGVSVNLVNIMYCRYSHILKLKPFPHHSSPSRSH